MKLKLFHLTGEATTATVPASVFEADFKTELIAQAVHIYRSNQRQGTVKTKNRGEVNRTTAKVYRQKGTGNARHGARSAPIFVGGGVTHGPRGNANWTRDLSKSMARKATIYALSAQAKKDRISLVADLDQLSGKTKEAALFVNKISAQPGKKLLIVIDDSHEKMLRALRNISNVVITSADRLNALDVAVARQIVIMKPAVAKLETRLVSETKKSEAK